MGGKRPDQYAIDPGESMATDYKFRRGPELKEDDKQEVAESRVEAKRESLIPHTGKNPALADLQARREQRRRQQEEQARHAAASESEAGASGAKRGTSKRGGTSKSGGTSKRGRKTPDTKLTE